MGQYQQWLQYQENDKRLSTQVEALEAELAQFQECLDRLEQQQQNVVPLTGNPIIQALVAHLSAHRTPPIVIQGIYMKQTAPQHLTRKHPGLAILFLLRS